MQYDLYWYIVGKQVDGCSISVYMYKYSIYWQELVLNNILPKELAKQKGL